MKAITKCSECNKMIDTVTKVSTDCPDDRRSKMHSWAGYKHPWYCVDCNKRTTHSVRLIPEGVLAVTNGAKK